MSDIVERLRGTADAFELAQAPHHLALYMRVAADEIERLRAGGCARDQTTTQYCAEAAQMAAEVERLRAALARSMTALDDWLNIFAEDMCEEERVREAKQRVYEHGSIHYISMVQQQNRAALRQKEGKP